MDFRGLAWKRVWKITFFGLKSGQDSENEAAHAHQEFPEVPPPPGQYFLFVLTLCQTVTERTDATKKKKEKEKWDNQT